jgi:hypothetical protein
VNEGRVETPGLFSLHRDDALRVDRLSVQRHGTDATPWNRKPMLDTTASTV